MKGKLGVGGKGRI